MEKVRVLVNGVLSRMGSITARNVLRNEEMHLIPVSIAPCGTYRKTSINQVAISLIDPSSVDANLVQSTPLFNHGRADVIVDFSPNSFFRTKIPNYMDAKTSYILSSTSDRGDIEKMSKMIKGLGINIALLPENSSEQDVLETIMFLYKKNEAGIFGEIFSLVDVAA